MLADESVAKWVLDFSSDTILPPTLLGLLQPVARFGWFKGASKDNKISADDNKAVPQEAASL